uniref:ATP-dependent DNA helicase n=1 Tax=Lactuca sativa TaxID=4236 RepID=A0A9R1XWV3_LACSA|nr:hypothetical protein LSAT_V11C100019150 [Lactuca sativa]
MSPLWASVKRLRLNINMRAVNDPCFSDFLLRVGDGKEETLDESFIRIPDNMSIPYTKKTNSVDALMDAIFPSLESNGADSKFIISRAIFSTKNESVDEINNKLIERFFGDFDEAEDDKNNLYPMEYLNSVNVSGVPLIIFAFQQNLIDAETAIGQHAGKRVFLPRIPLCPSDDDMFPFKLKRKQFPIQLSFSMTINKAQEQTIPNVRVYLPESVSSHGQLYVVFSRGISRVNTKVLVCDNPIFQDDMMERKSN